MFIFSFHQKAFALDDGIYTGLYKIVYAHGESTSRKNDKGVFEFTIKDNKVIKLFAYDDPNWKFYNLRYLYKIDPETNKLSSFSKGNDPQSGGTFKINMKGVFIGSKFDGNGNFELTSPDSLIFEKFIFESLD